MKKKMVSQKAINMFNDLLRRTESKIKDLLRDPDFCQRHDMTPFNWRWDKSFLDEKETKNTVRDMMRYLESQERQTKTAEELGVLSGEKLIVREGALKIVRVKLQERIEVFCS